MIFFVLQEKFFQSGITYSLVSNIPKVSSWHLKKMNNLKVFVKHSDAKEYQKLLSS